MHWKLDGDTFFGCVYLTPYVMLGLRRGYELLPTEWTLAVGWIKWGFSLTLTFKPRTA